MLKYFLLTLLLAVFAFNVFSSTPLEMVKAADNIRNPEKSFYMKAIVVDTDGDESAFDVLTRGKDKTIIKTLAPKRNIGRNLLMLEENMWLYIPNLKRAIRVGLSQKLTGQASNGDISRMRWHGDYDVKLEKKTKKEVVLFLTSNKKGLTYDKIRVYLDKKRYAPLRAKYYALTGKHLKTADFSSYKKIAGKVRPTVITITDANNKSKVSKIKIVKMEKRNLPSSMFTKSNLRSIP